MDPTGRRWILASLPAAVIGVLNFGQQLRAGPIDAAATLRLAMIERLGLFAADADMAAALAIGIVYWLPLLAVALLVSRLWAEAFARLRKRPLDSLWIPAAWFFALLLPATMPLGHAAVALSFGLVFGCHVFGGSRRQLVNPALLGAVFVAIAYPHLIAATAWLPGAEVATTWAAINAGGVDPVGAARTSLLGAFAGREIGAPGATSALACLLGGGYLIWRRDISPAVVSGGLLAVIIAAALAGEPYWPWHLAAGSFVFVLVFLACDPSIQPKSTSARVIYGVLFGALTVLLRIANPEHPESSWQALLLASLCVPFIERIAALWPRLRAGASGPV